MIPGSKLVWRWGVTMGCGRVEWSCTNYCCEWSGRSLGEIPIRRCHVHQLASAACHSLDITPSSPPATSPTPLYPTNPQNDCSAQPLININPLRPQIRLGQLDLVHQLRVRLGRVAERKHAPAEAEEEPCAERDEEPEWEL